MRVGHLEGLWIKEVVVRCEGMSRRWEELGRRGGEADTGLRLVAELPVAWLLHGQQRGDLILQSAKSIDEHSHLLSERLGLPSRWVGAARPAGPSAATPAPGRAFLALGLCRGLLQASHSVARLLAIVLDLRELLL